MLVGVALGQILGYHFHVKLEHDQVVPHVIMQIARQLVPLLFVDPAIDHSQLVPVTREEETVAGYHQPGHRHDHVLLLGAGRRCVTETRHKVEGHDAGDVFGRKA